MVVWFVGLNNDIHWIEQYSYKTNVAQQIYKSVNERTHLLHKLIEVVLGILDPPEVRLINQDDLLNNVGLELPVLLPRLGHGVGLALHAAQEVLVPCVPVQRLDLRVRGLEGGVGVLALGDEFVPSDNVSCYSALKCQCASAKYLFSISSMYALIGRPRTSNGVGVVVDAMCFFFFFDAMV